MRQDHHLLASIPEGFIIFDADLRFAYINDAGARFFGRPPSDLVGRTLEDAFPQVAGTPFPRTYRQALRDEITVTIEEQSASQPDRWIRSTAHPIPKGLAVYFRDITGDRMARRALEESEERFRSTFEQAAVGIAHVGLRGEWLRVNRRLAEILGRSKSDLADLVVQDVVESGNDNIMESVFAPLLNGEAKSVTNEFRMRREGRTAGWVQITGSLVRHRDGAPNYLILVVEDTTRRRDLEQQLRDSQKMEAVGRLAGGVAHDFNNILTAIGAQAELLRGKVDAPLRSELDEIVGAVTAAATLTRQLLLFSRRDVQRSGPVELDDAVSEAERMLRRLIGEDVHLLTQLGAPSVSVWSDPGRLQQLILNLVLNSRDALPSGGHITVSTECPIPVSDSRRRAEGSWCRLTVADDGSGMDEATIAHMFEPFFTTKARDRGTGLGLSIVHGIVRQAGGDIDVSSEVGQGTRVDVYLPVVDSKQTGGLDLTAVCEDVRGTETVLVAEDDAAVRRVVARVLEASGYAVMAAPSGEDALELARGYAGEIHLLLTDVVMPGMSGRALAERLVEARPGLRVLYMSGYTPDNVLRRGVRRALVRFLEKPFTVLSLKREVRRVLDEPLDQEFEVASLGQGRSDADT